MFERIKEFLGLKKTTEVKEERISRSDKEIIEDDYKKQMGYKDAELMKKNDEIKKLREQNKSLLEAVKKERKRKKEEKTKRLREKPFIDKAEIDIFDLVDWLRHGDGNLQVLSREHRYLGDLHTIKLRPVGDKLTWHIITKSGDESINVMDGFEFTNMIHRQDGFVDAMKTGNMILNRTYHKRTPVPDSYITEYGQPKHVETVLQEKKEQLNQMYSNLMQARKREGKERTRRKQERIEREEQKARADTLAKDYLSGMKDIMSQLKEYRETYESLEEERSRSTSLSNEVMNLEKAMNNMFKLIEKNAPRDEVRTARDEMKETMESFKELTSSDKGEEE